MGTSFLLVPIVFFIETTLKAATDCKRYRLSEFQCEIMIHNHILMSHAILKARDISYITYFNHTISVSVAILSMPYTTSTCSGFSAFIRSETLFL